MKDQASAQRWTIIPLMGFLTLALAAAGLAAGWWGFLRGPDLLTRTDNARRTIADRFVQRGTLLGRRDTVLVESIGTSGDYTRQVLYPALGPVLGYTHPAYGQAGLEASLDNYLRGVQGNDPWLIWWHHLLYGQPPPGLDVRLTIDLNLQRQADELLGSQAGAVVLLNAQSGEILAMASHPAFDPNQLDDTWESLLSNPQAPLLNRVTQGSYPLGELGEILFQGPEYLVWMASAPQLRLPVAYPEPGSGQVTPLQMVLAAAALSNDGRQPAPRLALAVHFPEAGWQVLAALGSSSTLISREQAAEVRSNLTTDRQSSWEIVYTPPGEAVTWYVSGSLPETSRLPLALVVVLESEQPELAEHIGQTLLQAAGGP